MYAFLIKTNLRSFFVIIDMWIYWYI